MKRKWKLGTLIALLAAGVFCSGGLANFSTMPYENDRDRLKFVSAPVAESAANAVRLSDGTKRADFYPTPEESSSRGVWLMGLSGALNYITETLQLDAATAVKFVLPKTADRMEEWFARDVDAVPTDARVEKSTAADRPFRYIAGENGRIVDREKFYPELCRRLIEGGGELTLPFKTVTPTVTVKTLTKETEWRAGFSTSIASSGAARKHNVVLALSNFDGMRIAPDEKVSFNAVVGARTTARGYKEAKIIQDGKYVEGVGGGVCQASTTLYNALLLGGMNIVAVCQHSLPTSYVPPSRDAMVNSSQADLVWSNALPHAVYLRTYATADTVTVALYGEKMKEKYTVATKILREIPPTVKTLIDDGTYAKFLEQSSAPYVLEIGKPGIVSEAYLTVTDASGPKTRRIRRNTYLATERVVIIGATPNKEVVSNAEEPIEKKV